MVEPGDLTNFLRLLSPAKYGDIRLLKQREIEVGLRERSFDSTESCCERVVCRAVWNGYGITSTDRTDHENVKRICELALKQARSLHQDIKIQPVEVEEERWEWMQKRLFATEYASDFLTNLKGQIEEKLVKRRHRSELVISHHLSDSTLFTSEGTQIREITPQTEIIVYLLIKEGGQGYASKIFGGIGGFERIQEQPREETIDSLVGRALDSAKAAGLPQKGKKRQVVLDREAAGAFAHEVSHFLEADIHQSRFFHGLAWAEELEIRDDLGLKNAYGSFHWDDEGVMAEEKTLVGKGMVRLLHTRLTAKPSEKAGNAHGVARIPRPMISNAYIMPSDWGEEEMLEETRRGIYARGLLKAEADTTDGRIEIVPEIAYIIEKGDLKRPIKHLRIIGTVRDLREIDAIGKNLSFRPNLEKGFAVSEGASQIRINKVACF